MVHTFEIKLTIDPKTVKTIKKHLKKVYFPKELREATQEGSIEILNPINRTGINSLTIKEITYDIEERTITRYSLNLVVNPQALLQGQSTIGVYTCSEENNNKLKQLLDEAISNLSNGLFTDSNLWTPTRVDYARDFKVDDPKKLIILVKRARELYWYRDNIKKEGSSYRESKSGVQNFYDKEEQVKTYTVLKEEKERLLEEAKGIFRVEMQCFRKGRLKTIKKREKLPIKDNIFDYLCSDISNNEITKNYEKTIGFDDFYSLNEAFKIIDRTSWSNSMKEKIKDVLRLIAQARSVSTAIEQFVEGIEIKNTDKTIKGSKNTFRNHLKKLKEINVNPVTIQRAWKIKTMKNPFNIDE